MRVDVRTDKTNAWREYRVFLNGREIKNCVMADEEEGIMLIQGRTTEFTEEEYVTRPHPTSPLMLDQQFTVKGKVEFRKI